VLFEDFVYMLYGAVQRARGLGAGWLAAYLEPQLAASLQQPELADVQGIVIGALRYEHVHWGDTIEVELEIEANYVELLRTGEQRRYYVVEAFTLTRAASAKSRAFSRAARHGVQLLPTAGRSGALRLDGDVARQSFA
jgi:hypothetical protein